MMLMASGGAAPLLTDGLISGGGFFTFSIISVERRHIPRNIQDKNKSAILFIPFERRLRNELEEICNSVNNILLTETFWLHTFSSVI